MVLSVSGRNSVHSLIGSRKHRKLAILDKKNNHGLQSLVIEGAVEELLFQSSSLEMAMLLVISNQM